MYARDQARLPGQDKLAKMSYCYLYPEARALWPGLPSTTVAALTNQVQAKYRAQRRAVVWTLEEQLATYRYPQKFSTWLFTITRNLAINQSRRRRRSPIRNKCNSRCR